MPTRTSRTHTIARIRMHSMWGNGLRCRPVVQIACRTEQQTQCVNEVVFFFLVQRKFADEIGL